MALSSLSHFKFRPPNVLEHNKSPYTDIIHTSRLEISAHKNTTVSRIPTSRYFYCLSHGPIPNRLRNFSSVLARAPGDATSDPGGEITTANDESSASVLDAWRNRSSSSGDGYVASFVSKLGLDNDPRDREQAVEDIWAYSLQGKHFVDNVMKYNGIVNLVVNLLQSDSESACEAAAGFLRTLSSINVYRDVVAECGAIEEITGLLRRSSLSSYVKEQAVGTLWNMSFDEKFRLRIANSDSFPLLVKFLEDDNLKVKEAAVGVLANLALSQSNHKIMVEAGVIPKLAKLLKDYADEPEVIGEIEAVMQKMNTVSKESTVTEEAARNALLELAKDEYNRVLIMEEGLLLVPLVGAAAYKSIKPFSYLQDQKIKEERPKETKRRSRGRSYGAEEIFLGLKTRKDTNLDEAKMNAKMAQTRQEFLARIGAIEIGGDNEPKSEGSACQRLTILPWSDAVARLVLIIGLEDESAIAAAAGSIADACINEHVRVSFREAGAIDLLVQLINHNSDAVKAAAVRALDRLSISIEVCKTIEAEGVLHPLINLLKNSVSCHTLTGMILNILTRVLDPNKEMKSKFYGGPANDSKKDLNLTEIPAAAKENEMVSSTSTSSLQIDSTFLSCLVDILKTSGLELQRKAASILEFIAMTKPHAVLIISEKIEAGLQEVLAQKSIIGTIDFAA